MTCLMTVTKKQIKNVTLRRCIDLCQNFDDMLASYASGESLARILRGPSLMNAFFLLFIWLSILPHSALASYVWLPN